MTKNSKANIEMLSEDSLMKLLTHMLSEGQAHATNFMKAFVIYIGIHAILLKTWLDLSNPEDVDLRYVTCGVGFATAILVGYVWPAWANMRNASLKDIESVNLKLGKPLRQEQLLSMKFITGTSGRFAIITFVGWAILAYLSDLS